MCSLPMNSSLALVESSASLHMSLLVTRHVWRRSRRCGICQRIHRIAACRRSPEAVQFLEGCQGCT